MSNVEALPGRPGPSGYGAILAIDQAVLDAIPAAVYVCAADGVLVRFNRKAVELWGRAPRPGDTDERFCGSLRLYQTDGTLLPHVSTPMEAVLRTGKPARDREVVIERPGGSRINVLVNIEPLRGDSGELQGAINCFQDITERKTSEERYHGIFENARVALWDQDFSPLLDRLEALRSQGVTDPRAYFEARPNELAEAVALVRVRDVNDYAVELFEAGSKERLLGALGATFLPETQPVFLEEMVALWEGKRKFESEAVSRTLQGRDFRVLLTIAWGGERCERSLVSILDISKQKASERRWKTLNRIAKALTQDLDLERIVQTVTDKATELSGAEFGAFFYNSKGEAEESYQLYTLSGAPREAFEKFGLPRNTAIFEPTFRGGGVVRSDDIRKDPRYGKNASHCGMPKGHLPVVSYLAVPVVSRSGEVHGGLFFGHHEAGVFSKESEDLVAGIAAHAAIAIDNARLWQAAQNEAEQWRRAEEISQRLASIVESSDDAIISKDLSGVIVSWNEGAERLFGYSAEEAVGQPVAMLMPEDRQHEEPRNLERIRSGEHVQPYETVRRRKDGMLVDVSLTISPVRNADGRIVGASKIARDVTERKRSEAVLARRVDELAALYEFTDRLHRAGSLGDVCNSALGAILRALQCDRASILLFDDAGVMRFAAWRGLSDGYRAAVDGHSPWTPDEKDPRPIMIEDVLASDLEDTLKETIRREGIRGMAFIPLISKERLVGKFMTYYEAPHAFSAGEVDLAVTIARQLGFSMERLRAEEELRRSEERFSSFMQHLPGLAWIKDVEGRYVYANEEAARIFRTEHAALYGRSDKDLFPPEVAGQFRDNDLQALAEGRGVQVVEAIEHEDGVLHHSLVSKFPMPGPDGATTQIGGMAIDITDRQRAENALRESEERLQLSLEAGQMGAWEWDIASGKVVWSPGLERIHGLEEGAFGGSLEDVMRDVYPEDAEALAAQIQHSLETRESYHVVYRIRRPDGEVRWLEAFGRLAMTAGGDPQKLAGVCMDITERRQAEMQRDLLVAELSHRVKNTLATVLSIARQSFSRTQSAEEASRTFSARIHALAQTHGRLADVNWSGVSLETIFLDELAPYRGQGERNIHISGPLVALNPKCALTLGMAIHELATNAAKHGALSTGGGSIDVAWKVDQAARELRIRWTESGGPPVGQPLRSGFGRLLLERVLASDLKGDVELDFARNGLECTIAIPLNEHTV